LWKTIRSNIKRAVSNTQFATWFSALELGSVSGGTVEIRVPDQLHAEWIEQHYAKHLEAAVAEVTPPISKFLFTVDPRLRRSTPARTQETLPLDDEWIRPRLHEQYTFDNFVVGPCNQLAHAAAVAVAASPATAYNPLFLHSRVGLGKSHLLQAICHAILEGRVGARVLYISCETFVNDFISAVERGRLEPFRARYRQADILLIDDIQFLTGKERTQEELFHTFNALYTGQKQIVLSSDHPPAELDGLEERLVSRFKWGLVARIGQPAFETRVAIIQKKCRLRGIVLPSEVEEYIASHVESNIRELEGAIVKLQGLACLASKEVDLALAQDTLAIGGSPPTPPSAEAILEAVCNRFSIKASELRSKKRNRSVVLPRQVTMYLARKITTASLEEIGAALGGRDHTTVLYGIQKIEKSRRDDPQLDGFLRTLEEELGQARGHQAAI